MERVYWNRFLRQWVRPHHSGKDCYDSIDRNRFQNALPMTKTYETIPEWARGALRGTSELRVIQAGLDHAEDIAFDREFVWNGGEGGQIYRGSYGDTAQKIATVAGRPLGIEIDRYGGALVCCVSPARVVRVSVEGRAKLICDDRQIAGLCAPNYGIFLPDGTYVFSDSGTFGHDDGRLVAIDGSGVRTVDTSAFRFPNGLAATPDGTVLYVVESTLPGISALRINRDGTLSDRQVVCVLTGTVPDGIALDSQGRLLVSCWTPDAIYLVTAGHPELLFADQFRQQLLSPTNLAFVPGTHEVVCVNFGGTFLTSFLHDAAGARPGLPDAEWLARLIDDGAASNVD